MLKKSNNATVHYTELIGTFIIRNKTVIAVATERVSYMADVLGASLSQYDRKKI